MSTHAKPKQFTGRHFALIAVSFFAVVIAVNVTMATLASRSFSGAIVKNGYVASQDFNDWIAAGRRQQALGWKVDASAHRAWLEVSARGADGAPLSGLAATAELSHPLAAGRTVTIALHETAPGFYAAPHGRQAGQWDALILLKDGPRKYELHRRLIVPKG